MTRNDDRRDEVDAALRMLPLPSDDEARLRSDDSARRALLQEVLMSDPTPSRSRWLRHRRVVVGGAVAAVLVGAGAVAVADVFTSGTQLYAGCLINGGDADTVGGGFSDLRLSADPVGACQEEWVTHVGTEAPPMTAYVDAEGQVSVIPDGWKVPDGLDALPADVTPDTSLVDLEFALNNEGSDFGACLDQAQGEALARSILDELGLTDWSVQTHPEAEWGDGACAVAGADAETSTVFLNARPDDGGLAQHFPALAEFIAMTEAECLALPAAVTRLEETVGTEMGIIKLTQVEDAAADCTTVEVVSGGSVFVELTGPSS